MRLPIAVVIVLVLAGCEDRRRGAATPLPADEVVVRLSDVSPYFEYRDYYCMTEGYSLDAVARARGFDAAVSAPRGEGGSASRSARAEVAALRAQFGCRSGPVRRYANLTYTFETGNPVTPTWMLRCRYGSDTSRAEALVTARRAAGFYLARKAERQNLPDFRDEMEARYRCR